MDRLADHRLTPDKRKMAEAILTLLIIPRRPVSPTYLRKLYARRNHIPEDFSDRKFEAAFTALARKGYLMFIGEDIVPTILCIEEYLLTWEAYSQVERRA